ncbi:abnormal spindle-like microcephaly-associated protein homolog isoform X2 [Ananas comosus]|uniref:Abnormal spindle-like microcephaly-associated protein homolog isoform X2 n=1 Tax=Ananas comosus TaxID=4615 RepID=A0A6P5FGQ0_ANACO|nr:abnormal spindle-like microcephaly-associated protein homolog isoform X2 [Ananas comosus]
MERRRRPPAKEAAAAGELPRGGASSPPPNPSPLFRDVSNYKTPHPSFPNPKTHNPASPLPIFFTASKNTLTPAASSASAFRRRPSAAAAVAARRLRALELDQSKSSRKVQIRREKALKSFSTSLSSWLNLLFRNPSSCGCDIASRRQTSGLIGKRQSLDAEREMGVGGHWRSPKRRRDRLWKCGGEEKKGFSFGMVASLKVSLQDVCSFDDLKERMEGYISREGCDEVLLMMYQVCKNIDEGRLKMKANCPLVSDLRLKEKATRILMCYNPEWLRIGLHIVLAGDSLLCNEEREHEKEDLFLRMIIEKQFFSHSGVAKSFAYNKLVEGLYRPGYFEALGSIILKRFILLVISLDKAKTESSLPIKYGIDGLDGGSPLLFCRHSNIKSSQQIIHESLSEVMHGEGDLLVHLTIVGCKLNYVQSPLSEYDFIVRNLFQDLQDGIVLCRALQLLLCDASIISKVVAPSDTRKKNLQNCSIAIEYLKQAGVPLSAGDGVMIVAEDIANGDKELTMSLLWSVFVHLQFPLLVQRTSLVGEIAKLKASDMDLPKYNTKTNMALLLEWIQVVCGKYSIRVDTLSSLVDSRALCCLMNFYLNIDIPLTSQKELQVSHILNNDASPDERSVTILLTFLASQLLNSKKLDKVRKLTSRILEDQNAEIKVLAFSQMSFSGNGSPIRCRSQGNKLPKCASEQNNEGFDWAATVIQSQVRRIVARSKFLKIKRAASLLQSATRAWLAATSNIKHAFTCSDHSVLEQSSGNSNSYLKFMMERHNFVRTKRSVRLIQRALRAWIAQRRQLESIFLHSSLPNQQSICSKLENPRYQESMAAEKIQLAWRRYAYHKQFLENISAVVKIQSNWRSWSTRIHFSRQVRAIITIQARIRCLFCLRAFRRFRLAALVIQRFVRGWLARKALLGACFIQSKRKICGLYSTQCAGSVKSVEYSTVLNSVLRLQRWWRRILLCRSELMSVILIQACIRGWSSRREANKLRYSISVIQKWWRNALFRQSRKRSVLIIQAHVRCWIARQAVRRDKKRIILIQSQFRGYLVRKNSKEEVSNLRHRLQKSATNVKDDMRLINRLLSALSQLLACRNISSIRQTCATLSMATEHSEKCCEMLADAGAVEILLKQVHSLNRGVPDQEVLKHVLCTLRNIAHFPKLLQVLINAPRSVEIIFQELLRNKSGTFFVACDLLKKITAAKEGRELTHKLHGHVRRLTIIIQDLERKIELEKRNARRGGGRDLTMLLRHKETVSLLAMIIDNNQ